jgi:hypothetical protein
MTMPGFSEDMFLAGVDPVNPHTAPGCCRLHDPEVAADASPITVAGPRGDLRAMRIAIDAQAPNRAARRAQKRK